MTTGRGFGYTKVKDRYEEISPIHNLGRDATDYRIFGSEGQINPRLTGKKFRDEMRKLGNRSELFVYGQPHDFSTWASLEIISPKPWRRRTVSGFARLGQEKVTG